MDTKDRKDLRKRLIAAKERKKRKEGEAPISALSNFFSQQLSISYLFAAKIIAA